MQSISSCLKGAQEVLLQRNFNNSPKEREKIAHKTIFNDSFAALFARQSFPVFFSF